MNKRVIMVTIIISMLIVSGFVSPSGTRSQYGVSIECESREHYVEMEQYTYYLIKITNTGESDDTYNLTRDLPPENWQANLSSYMISIPAGEYRNIMLKVKTSCKCESGETIVINVTASSESDPGVFDTVQTITTFAHVKVVLDTNTDYVQLDRSESYIHEIIVRNEGSENDTFWITVSQTQELSPVLDAEYISLQSNTSGKINLTVTASPSAPYGYYELSVQAESLHNSERFDFLAITIIIGKIELVAQNIKLSNKHLNEGDTATISLEIVNKGTVNATDLMITIYNLTKDGPEMEIGSDLTSISLEDKVTIQKEITYSSDFDGILIKAKIKGKYEIWQESFSAKELGLEQEQENAVPYLLIALIVIILVFATIILLRSKKRKRE